MISGTVIASGDLEAREIVLINDWNHNPESDPEGDGLDELFGTPNVISLTAGGELTVGTITGGLYAQNETEAAENEVIRGGTRASVVALASFDQAESPAALTAFTR